jgi:aryl-alcohol dehydrogenase-like predicted oxidoreductase
MTTPAAAGGLFKLGGDLTIARMGYGAMQLAGPGAFGPPADADAAVAVLRRAVQLGVNHIDTSDYYGPFVVNELIKTALHPYPDDLVIVTKVGFKRGQDGAWLPAQRSANLRAAVHDNLTRLGVDVLDLVNLRVGGPLGPEEGSIARQFEMLAGLRDEGLIRHLGVSNVTPSQLVQGCSIAPVSEVQNLFNIVTRRDATLVDTCEHLGIAYVPFFPLGGTFASVASTVLDQVAARHDATSAQVALAWLLARSPSIVLIPGTSSVHHLELNVAAATLRLSEADLADLDAITEPPVVHPS